MASRRWSSVAAWTRSVLVMVFLSGCGGGSDSGGGAAGPVPTADAGADETVAVGIPVILDGSASEGPAGAPVSYQWTLTSKPSGSTASLRSPNSARATFTPDVAGAYTATLVVQANGVASQPDTVSITCSTGNIAPRANAGPDRSAAPGGSITLDGTASRDPNNTSLTYSWRIVTQPSGSNPVLSNASTTMPTFRADVPGVYTVALTVSDGSLTSAADQVTITVATGNLPPVANAGPDQTVTTGQLVTLNGTGSTDPNGDALTYGWCLKGRPVGSTATLSGANTARPTFTPDVAGSYVLCLTVNDGQAGSASDSIVVEAGLPSFVNAVLEAYVKASNPGGGFRVGEGMPISTGDQFGDSVALSGNTLVVGAPHEDSCATGINANQANNDCEGAGAVYVFTRTNEAWSQQAYIKGPNAQTPHNGAAFGFHVAVSGDTLAVSGPGDTLTGGGIISVYTRTNGVWTEEAHLESPDDPSRGFSTSSTVALDGDTLAVGSYWDTSCATGINGDPSGDCLAPTGAVHVFTRTNGAWTRQAYIKPSIILRNVVEYWFGFSIALKGDTLAVGALGENGCGSGVNSPEGTAGCAFSGAVYVFSRTNGAWRQEAFIKASNPDFNDQFGRNVALSADTLAVTATQEASCATGVNGDQANNGCSGAGAAYVFTRSNGTWSQQAYIKASNTESVDFFGQGIAMFDDTLAVSAESEDSCATGINGNQANNGCNMAGAVYVFHRRNGVWNQQAYVKASNTDPVDGFGGSSDEAGGAFHSSVALSSDTLAIGALRESSCASGINGNQMDNSCVDAGAVYVYRAQ